MVTSEDDSGKGPVGKRDESARAAGTAARADSSGAEATAASDGAGTDAVPPASVTVPGPVAAAPSEPAAAAMRQQQAQTGRQPRPAQARGRTQAALRPSLRYHRLRSLRRRTTRLASPSDLFRDRLRS